ncbi:hypothetical protein I4641_05570 [Waterburya agarophytonicola K14]|uniref:Uncharacterized protein n=1 Tax=Waterburya agarophytonicola KI4 TaxID=2874699 RepID=A0A964BQQ3_9CYAN|nr:hypothetical protein [Waterburya agarophytonicola]MCC0176446.1 hypothetical protein [Waterburya agarophytonicola KI4]
MTARLIQIVDTSAFAFPSPDPSGIILLNGSNTLLISDSEVNENQVFAGFNLFEINFNGSVVNFGDVLEISDEPTGLSYNPSNGNLFISDDTDNSRRIYQVDPGNDNIFGTSDDIEVSNFRTLLFGSNDAEDVAYELTTGNLFIADGLNSTIYEVTTNGNLVSSFSTASFGLFDPEGIADNPQSENFFIVGEPTDEIFEVTRAGDLVQRIEIGNVNPVQPAGIAVAPRSTNIGFRSLYVVDRGIDELEDPNENDGKLYEFALETSIYVTSRETVNLKGRIFQDEDVVAYDPRKAEWIRYFDGSDVGLANNDIDGLHVNDDGSLLLSLNLDTNIDGFGFIDDTDIVRFVPTSTGNNTTGSFERYFDGSDVGLDSNPEDIDALSIAPNGDILISTNGAYNINGLVGTDEDILRFSPTSLGENTAGSFTIYFDGSDVGLNNSSAEDIKGLSLQDDGELVLSTLGDFGVTGLNGIGGDLFSFDPDSLGDNTSGTFNQFSNAFASGFNNQILADFSIV